MHWESVRMCHLWLWMAWRRREEGQKSKQLTVWWSVPSTSSSTWRTSATCSRSLALVDLPSLSLSLPLAHGNVASSLSLSSSRWPWELPRRNEVALNVFDLMPVRLDIWSVNLLASSRPCKLCLHRRFHSLSMNLHELHIISSQEAEAAAAAQRIWYRSRKMLRREII